MPMRHSAAPVTIRMHPAMPSAGVIVGVIGNGSVPAVVDVTRFAEVIDDCKAVEASVDWIATPLEVVDAFVVAEL